MDSNICLFLASEVRTMAFRGRIKPERWNRVLNQVDDMTRLAINRALGEGIFDYEFTWRTNSNIIGAFIKCLARAKIGKWEMFKLCSNLFNPIWCIGLEEAIMSLDKKCRVPLPKMYMAHPLGSFDLAIVPRCPALVIRDNLAFSRAWSKMEASINFLLRWRGILDNLGKDWLQDYLNIFKSYVEPGTNLDKLEILDFCIPNLEETSKERNSFVFPPNFQSNNPNEIVEIIMVFRK